MERLEIVSPMIPCSDYWPVKIPTEKLMAYKRLLDEGQITRPKVIYNREKQTTLVSYKANQPHEWILERLKEIAKEYT